jgi:hypothetical protein
MSELSEKYAAVGGNRRLYCFKIEDYVSSCSLNKSCAVCKEELNAKKGSNVPGKDSGRSKTESYNNIVDDKTRPQLQGNSLICGQNDAGKPNKAQKSDDSGTVCRRRRLKSRVK